MEFFKMILLDLGYILIFPGFLFCFLGGMMLCGIGRWAAAKIQRLEGPSVLQPVYDLSGVFKEETVIPAGASRAMFLTAPLAALTALVVVQLFIPVFSFTAFSGGADIVVLLCLLLIPAVAEILGAASTGAPFAEENVRRKMIRIAACEVPLALVLLAVGRAVGTGTGSGIVFSLQEIATYQAENGCLLARISMIPAAAAFLLIISLMAGTSHSDAGVETENGECPDVPYSGAPLAVLKLSQAVRMLTLTSLFTALFLGGFGTRVLLPDALITFFFCAVVVCAAALIDAFASRLNFRVRWSAAALLAALSLLLTWYGL